MLILGLLLRLLYFHLQQYLKYRKLSRSNQYCHYLLFELNLKKYVNLFLRKMKLYQEVMHKIAKEGGTITVDPAHKIDVPAPNKWWDA
jgi:hypothetical protein